MGRSISRSSTFVFGIVLLAAAVAWGAERKGPKPVLDPSQGDGGVSAFYVWDKEVPGTPGQLLRQEPLPDNLMLLNASKGMRVLYTSIDGVDGKTPIAVSGAIYFPKRLAPAQGWPIIAWAHGTAGVCEDFFSPENLHEILNPHALERDQTLQ